MELHWPLIIFTTLLAWSAGLFASQCILAITGKAKKTQMTSWIVAGALLVAGGIAVFFHLGHAERIFNGFGHLTSGITQELIAMVVLAVVAVVFLVMMLRSEDRGTVPAWIAVVGIVASVALVAVMGHSYMMASRPTWDSLLWVLYLIGNACVLGPATLVLLMALKGDEADCAAKMLLIGALIGALCAAGYAAHVQMSGGSYMELSYYFDPTFPNKAMMSAAAVLASVALPMWGGAVAVGGVIPVITAFLAKGRAGNTLAAICGATIVLALIGAVCMRVVFFTAGVGVFMFF